MAKWSIGFLIGGAGSLFLPVIPPLGTALLLCLLVVGALLFVHLCCSYLALPPFTFGWVALGGLFGTLFVITYSAWQFSPLISIKFNQSNQLSGVVKQVQRADELQRVTLIIGLNSLNSEPLIGESFIPAPYRRQVKLNWYRPDKSVASLLAPGTKINSVAKLTSTYGYENGTGFNYQQWLTSKGVIATGTIKQLTVVKHADPTISRWFKEQIFKATMHLPHQGFLLAIFLGDKSKISAKQYERLNKMGISHLFAISGLHTGLIYLVVAFVLKLVGRYLALPTAPLIFIGLMALWSYVSLIGFPISATRAGLLISLWQLSSLFLIALSPSSCLCLVAVVSCLINPFSVLSASWWLSFTAVTAILLFYHLSLETKKVKSEEINSGYVYITRVKALCLNVGGYLKRLVFLQVALSLFMLPVMVFWFNGFSLSGLWINLVAMPWFVFVVVPLTLLSSLTAIFSTSLANILFGLADGCLDLLVTKLSLLPGMQIWLTVSQSEYWLLALAIFTFVYFRSVKVLFFSMVASLCCLEISQRLSEGLPYLNKNKTLLSVLDVGQGTSVFYKSSDVSLLYDLGPVYSSGFSATKAAVIPWLVNSKQTSLDYLVISHLDSDHVGDLPLAKAQLTIAEIVTNCALTREHSALFDGPNTHIEVLWPRVETTNWPLSRNDSSCVLKITNKASNNAVLLTADITEKVEAQLVLLHASGELNLSAEVLMAPHHGSRYSSSQVFLDTVKPQMMFYSAGVNNRFGFPRPEVRERANKHTDLQFSTSKWGKIEIEFPVGNSGNFLIDTQLNAWLPFWKKQNPFIFSYQIR